jgi:hypothetical protein
MTNYKVKSIKSELCKDWLLHKHYAKRLCSISYSFGLFNKNNILVGVITFGMPPSSTLAESICGLEYKNYILELNRLVVNDGLPKNCLSYFVSNAIKKLPNNKIIVSFADANMYHNGYIYQATNFIYTGTSSNTHKFIDKFGKEFHFRNIGHYQKKLVKKINLIDRIVKNLSDDLLKKEYRTILNKNKFTGHCYVASETYYHLSEEKLNVYYIKHENSTHWFLKDDKNNIIDITKEQFKTPVPYNQAKRGFFLTKTPSKRSLKLIQKVINYDFKIIKKRLNENEIEYKLIANFLRENKKNFTNSDLSSLLNIHQQKLEHWFRLDKGFSFPSIDEWLKLKSILNFDNTFDKVMTSFKWIPCTNDIIKKLELKKIDILPKHRYLYFKGNKRFKKNCRKNLMLEVKKYPKGQNKRYDTSYKPTIQTEIF